VSSHVPGVRQGGSFVERLRREAKAAANLNHPNIVAIYDWGKQAKHVLYRHESYVAGRSLSGRHKQRSDKLHPTAGAEWPPHVSRRLGFAHTHNGVVHREVKHGNVW